MMDEAPDLNRQPALPTVEIGVGLVLDDAERLAAGLALPTIHPAAQVRITGAHDRLKTCVRENRLVYGVTTGFGPLANRIVGAGEIETLQRHLVYHLATGVGDIADWQTGRMIVLARLSSISQGVSGASPDLISRLMAVLESPFAPKIPLKGTVGASGDLTPLSHLALALMGEGGFIDRQGLNVDGDQALACIGGPLPMTNRDALALVNGTSVMTAIAGLNAIRAARLVRAAEHITIGYAELLQGTIEAWHPAFAEARPHPGQCATTERLRHLARGSKRLNTALAGDIRLDPAASEQLADRTLQDAYTIRCAPQVLGAVRDMLSVHSDIVERELNSATDNPLFPEGVPALHGGNFMGQHVAFASDALSNAVLAAAAFAERQVARLTDEKLNGALPAFLHLGPGGLNSGLMGAQVTATAILAEMRTHAVPASVQSISTNGANQDFVSMGTIAARNARDHLHGLSQILAILAIAVAQGVDCQSDPNGFAPATDQVYASVRSLSQRIGPDRPLSEDIARVATALTEGMLDKDM